MCWDCWTNTWRNRNLLTTFRTDCAALHQVNSYRNWDESSIYTRATGIINGRINQQVTGIDDSLVISLFHIGLMSSPWSWLKLGCLRMRRASFTLLLNQFFSLLMIVLPSQSILWSSSMVCWATPDLSTSPFRQFLLCSVLRVLPVSPTCEWSQSWQGMR